MIFKQYYLPRLSQASYLIGDESSRLAAIVDPQRDLNEYLEELESLQLTLKAIFLTHIHEDFVAGHIGLCQQTGAKIYLGEQAVVGFPFHPLADGDERELGTIRLKILATPGHTPESISIVVYHLKDNAYIPKVILTGDTLLVGEVGRPMVMSGVDMDASSLARQLFHSLHRHLLSFPSEVKIFPAHGEDRPRGGALRGKLSSTLGEEIRSNKTLQLTSQESFVQTVLAEPTEVAPYFSHIAFLNRREHHTLDHIILESYRPLTLEEVLHEKSLGVQILDVRSLEEFNKDHLCGSVHISLSGKFEAWAGAVLKLNNPIILICDHDREREAIARLASIGIEQVKGFLTRGFAALAATPELTRQTVRLSVHEFQERMGKSDSPYVLDVRSPREWRVRHIEESRNIPLQYLQDNLSDIPSHQPVLVYSSDEYRSSIAASLLEHKYFSNISVLRGGFDAWEAVVVNPALQPGSFQQDVKEKPLQGGKKEEKP